MDSKTQKELPPLSDEQKEMLKALRLKYAGKAAESSHFDSWDNYCRAHRAKLVFAVSHMSAEKAISRGKVACPECAVLVTPLMARSVELVTVWEYEYLDALDRVVHHHCAECGWSEVLPVPKKETDATAKRAQFWSNEIIQAINLNARALSTQIDADILAELSKTNPLLRKLTP